MTSRVTWLTWWMLLTLSSISTYLTDAQLVVGSGRGGTGQTRPRGHGNRPSPDIPQAGGLGDVHSFAGGVDAVRPSTGALINQPGTSSGHRPQIVYGPRPTYRPPRPTQRPYYWNNYYRRPHRPSYPYYWPNRG